MFCRFLVTLLALLLVTTTIARADMPRYECRTQTVEPGERCWVWFAKPTERLSDTAQPLCLGLPPGWKCAYPAKYNSNQAWAMGRAYCVTVPLDATPGQYHLPWYRTIPGTSSAHEPPQPASPALPDVTITVVAKIERPYKIVCAGATAIDIQATLDQGFNVELPPGLYRWDREITMPAGAMMRSAGAHILRLNNDAYRDCIFTGGASFMLEGLTLEHDRGCDSTWGMVMHYFGPMGRDASPTAPNVTIRRCKLIGTALGRTTDANVLIEECLFERAGTDILPDNCVLLGNRFVGSGMAGEHATLLWGAKGVLMGSNAYDGTSRAIVAQVGSGEGLVTLDTRISRQYGGENNSGEGILIESEQPWTRCAFYDTFVYDSMGPAFYLSGDKMTDILVYGLDAHVEKRSVILNAYRNDGTPASITDVEFTNVECTSNWYLNGPLSDIALINVQWLDRGPDGHGNDSGPFPQDRLNWSPVSMFPFSVHPSALLGTGWTFQNCGVVSRDNGYREVRSFVPWQVTVTGEQPVLIEHIPVQWHPNPAADPYGPLGKHLYVIEVQTSATRLDDDGKYRKAHWVKRFLARNNGLWNTTPTVIVDGLQTTYQHREDEDWDVRIKGEYGGIGVYATIGPNAPGESRRVQFHNTKVTVHRVPGPTYPE